MSQQGLLADICSALILLSVFWGSMLLIKLGLAHSFLYGIFFFLSLVVLMSIHKDIFLCKNKEYHILPNYHTMSLGFLKITG